MSRIGELNSRYAEILSRNPWTWRFVGHYLQLNAPWQAEGDRIQPWTPTLRLGQKRAKVVAAAKLLTPESSLGECADFLAASFPTSDLSGLIESLRAEFAVTPGTALQSPWWELTPGFKSGESATDFPDDLDSLRADLESSIPVASCIFEFSFEDKILEFSKHASHVEATDDPNSSIGGYYFASTGSIVLPPRMRSAFQGFAWPSIRSLVTSLPLELYGDQASAHKFLLGKAFLTTLSSEIAHLGHSYLCEMQITLAADIFRARWPLSAITSLASDSPADEVTGAATTGRRHVLGRKEATALSAKLQSFEMFVEDGSGPATDRLHRDAAIAIFDQLSLIGLTRFVDTLVGIDGHVDADFKRFHESLDRINQFLGLLYLKNQGLAGMIANTIRGNNQELGRFHEARDIASLVREELIKTIGTYDYRLGWRFSTYAVKRVPLELRRKVHQERQLIKLSPDMTTAMPRVIGIAKASELSPNHPDYLGEIADIYNETFRGKGGKKMDPKTVAMILDHGRLISIDCPVNDDGEDTVEAKLNITGETSAAPMDSEINEGIQEALRATPPEEALTLSLASNLLPGKDSLTKFIRANGSKAIARGKSILTKRARPISEQTNPHLKGPGYQITLNPVLVSERQIRSKATDEQARQERREKPEES